MEKRSEEKEKKGKKDKNEKKETEVIEDDGTNSEESAAAKEDGVTTIQDLLPIFGACCAITSLYMLFPECAGTYGNATIGCLELECKSCKISQRKGDYCICFNIGVLCVKPTLCQCCCFDGRCAIPCHEEVPCLANVCGLNCAYNYACACHCCKTLGYIREAAEDRAERRADGAKK